MSTWWSRRKMRSAGRLLLRLVLAVWLAVTAGCRPAGTDACRIGMAGKGSNADRLEEALLRLGERPERLHLEARPDLAAYDLLVFAEGALSERTAGFRQLQPAIAAFVKNGGGLLVFGLQQNGYQPDFLPYEVRFAADSSGWGSYDFSDVIARPEHPLFNVPHRLTYLAGLEETDRIVYTGPEWEVLLAKDPRHPEFDYSLTDPDFTVGSIFEAAWGRGHVLVCQPIVERYYAEGLQMAPHPLEQGVLLFENIVEYMKSQVKGRRLPIARAQAVPSHGPAGAVYVFRASADGADGKIEVNWDFGDGSRGEGLNCAHHFSRYGVYIASATVRTASGSDRATCRVEVRERRPMRWGEHLIDAFTGRYYPDPGRVGVNYRTALVLNGMLDVYKRNSDPAILQYIESFFERRLISRWAERPYQGNLQPDHNFVDIYSMAAPAWRLYRITGKREYLSAASDLWEQSLAVDSQLPPGSLWSPYDWHGRRAIVDFTYFKAHLRAVAWECTGRLELLDEAARQMILFRDVFQDKSDSLFFMAVDLDHQAYFTSPERPSGLNDSKWGRANGWVALALAELLARLPADHPDRPELVEISRDFAAGLARAQDPRTG
ncbi:MAG: glycoside hydrolase family 88 protein, partial [Candidatus Glassbacteria bacterium]